MKELVYINKIYEIDYETKKGLRFEFGPGSEFDYGYYKKSNGFIELKLYKYVKCLWFERSKKMVHESEIVSVMFVPIHMTILERDLLILGKATGYELIDMKEWSKRRKEETARIAEFKRDLREKQYAKHTLYEVEPKVNQKAEFYREMNEAKEEGKEYLIMNYDTFMCWCQPPRAVVSGYDFRGFKVFFDSRMKNEYYKFR